MRLFERETFLEINDNGSIGHMDKLYISLKINFYKYKLLSLINKDIFSPILLRFLPFFKL